jgi:hypothetical protein
MIYDNVLASKQGTPKCLHYHGTKKWRLSKFSSFLKNHPLILARSYLKVIYYSLNLKTL